MRKWNIAARRRARRFALQALYQWHFNPAPVQTIIAGFLTQAEMVSVDTDFFSMLVKSVIATHRALDESIEPFLLKSQSGTQPVERAILRMGAYELQTFLDRPYRVIMNEAIELAKAFGSLGSYKYINGVLRKLAQQYRPYELTTA